MLMIAEKKRFMTIISIAAFLLLVPLIAMQITNEVNWSVMDFVVAGGLLFGAGFTIEFILRKVKKDTSRISILAGVLIVFLLLWTEMAVGIFH